MDIKSFCLKTLRDEYSGIYKREMQLELWGEKKNKNIILKSFKYN